MQREVRVASACFSQPAAFFICVDFCPIYFSDSPSDQGETHNTLCSVFRGLQLFGVFFVQLDQPVCHAGGGKHCYLVLVHLFYCRICATVLILVAVHLMLIFSGYLPSFCDGSVIVRSGLLNFRIWNRRCKSDAFDASAPQGGRLVCFNLLICPLFALCWTDSRACMDSGGHMSKRLL